MLSLPLFALTAGLASAASVPAPGALHTLKRWDTSICDASTAGVPIHCAIPYDKITPNPDVLAGMCPNGDREALTLYLLTTARLTSPSAGPLLGTRPE